MTTSNGNLPQKKISDVSIWVLTDLVESEMSQESKKLASCCQRLGDARRLADAIDGKVGVLCLPSHFDFPENSYQSDYAGTLYDQAIHPYHQSLFRHGADLILHPKPEPELKKIVGSSHKLTNLCRSRLTAQLLADHPVKVIFAGGTAADREWASLLAARADCEFISPAIWVQKQGEQWTVTHVDATGNRSCQKKFEIDRPIVATMKAGVAEPMAPDPNRFGNQETYSVIELLNRQPEEDVDDRKDENPMDWLKWELIPVKPSQADIRDVNKLIAGGRGLGSKDGFQLLRQVAELLGAGVAASRMAVDQGWIEYERQVGQTGKTVDPDLYIACGISGASHHLDGITAAKQVVAINCDPQAPIMKRAQLGLVGDLYPILESFRRKMLERTSTPGSPSSSDSGSQ